MSFAAAALGISACDGSRQQNGSAEPPHSASREPARGVGPAGAHASSPPNPTTPAVAPPLGERWLRQLPRQARQLVVVTSADWQASTGTLQRYALHDSAWQKVSSEVPVVLGKHGLGWGRGIHDAEPDGPQKREGDGKAPAGLFLLNRSYGHGAGAELPTGLQHTVVDETWRCVDDVRSRHYGELLDSARVEQDWKSAEQLQRSDPLYEIIVLVEHNAQHQRGGGSCIFLHTWRFFEDRPSVPRPTVGCTAMDRRPLLALAGWLRPGAILAQLPLAQARRD